MAENKTFSRPIGTVVSDDEIVDVIDSHYRTALAMREFPETKWNVSAVVLEGFNNFDIDWAGRRAFFNPGDPKGSMRTKIPELLTRYKREQGRLLSVYRVPSTRPKVAGDPNVWRANRFATGACGFLAENGDFERVYLSTVNNLLTQGTAGVLTYWDDFAQEVCFRAIPAWQLYPFPSTAVNDAQLEGIVWSRVVSGEWIKQNLPDAESEKTIKVTTPFKVMSGDRSYFEGYEIKYVFFKPSRRFPQGEQCIIVGDKCFRRMGELPYFHSGKRVLPIAVARYTEKPDCWWGESFAFPVAMLNRDINRLMTLLMRRAVLRAHPGYLLVPQGTVSKDDLMNQIGGIVQYNAPLGSNVQQPFWLTYPSGAPDNSEALNRVQSYMDDVSSQHAFTRGTTAGRVDSTPAIEQMVRADQIPTEPTYKSLNWAIQHSFGIAIDLAYRKWDTPRRVSVVGPMGLPMSMLAMGRDLPTMDDIEVITGMDMAMDKPSQIGFLTRMATPPAAGIPANLTQEEFRRGLVALGVHIPGVSLISPDEEQAWLESQKLYGDGMTPQPVDPPDPRIEDLAIHLRIHRAFAATPEVHNAHPNVRGAFSQHIAMTIELMNPSPMPAKFDRDTEEMDTDNESEDMVTSMLGG